MFGKKKQKAKSSTVTGSKSVNAYFLPVFIATLIVMLTTGLIGNWLILQHTQKQSLLGVAANAGSVARLLEARLETEKSRMELLAGDAQLLQLLMEQADISKVQQRLKQHLPAAEALLVVPLSMDQDLMRHALFDSYQVVDLHERTLETGIVPAVEAMKSTSGTSFVLVVPVKQHDKVLATLVGKYPVNLIGDEFEMLRTGEGVLGLNQGAGGDHFVLASSPGFVFDAVKGAVVVNNTLWEVRYGLVAPVGLVQFSMLLVLLLIAAVIIYLVFQKQQKKLADDIKVDLGTAVALVDATLKRTGAPMVQTRLQESASALDVLTQYAKTTFATAKAAGAEGNKAGQPMSDTGIDHEAGVLDESLPDDDLPDEIFLVNDIRGISGQTLTSSMAQQLGRAIGTLALNSGEISLLVGHDARLSSEELSSALIAGVLSSGCDVLDLGLVPVPLLYFAGQVLSSRSCVMITGGHNPAQYNGFKVIIEGKPLLDAALLELKKMVESDALRSGAGTLQTRDISGEYIRQVSGDIQLLEPRKVVVDGGNGVGGRLLVRLLENLNCEVVELFCDPDGAFPNHFPDPAQPENLSALALEVQAQGADFGVALDGDGDRLALVDEKGEQVATDLLIMLLADDIIRRHPGADIIYDVKSSSYLASYILSSGGRPVMWKTGHSLMKLKMQETGSLLGGEQAGHLYIKDRWFGFDDGLYATVRLLELFCLEAQPVSAFFALLPKAPSSSTMEVEVPREQALFLLHELAQKLDSESLDIVDLDGLRLEFANGWGLIRVSNTLPRLVFRFEGRDQAGMETIQKLLRTELQVLMPELVLPF